MKKGYYITIFILFLALQAMAQGSVVVHTDPRLSVLLNKKKAVMQASVAKPATHHSAEMHITSIPAHPGTEAPPPTSRAVRQHVTAEAIHTPAVTKPAMETPHSAVIDTRTAAPVPVYHREREGRVIYSGKGFRVQIYSGSDREKAIAIKTEFMRHFPGTRTYLSYVSPCFRVKVGNFRHRSDALGMFKDGNVRCIPPMCDSARI